MARVVDEMDSKLIDISRQVLACAFDVHSRLGPGLLESTYQACLRHRIGREGFRVDVEVPVSIAFDGITIPTAYRMDLVVEERLLVELKTVDRLSPVHVSQVRTYLTHSNLEVGLLLNFNVKHLREGIRRFDNRLRPARFPSPPSPVLPRLPFRPLK